MKPLFQLKEIVPAMTGIGALVLHQTTIMKLLEKSGMYDSLRHYQENPPTPKELLFEYGSIIGIETAAGMALGGATAYLSYKAIEHIQKK